MFAAPSAKKVIVMSGGMGTEDGAMSFARRERWGVGVDRSA